MAMRFPGRKRRKPEPVHVDPGTIIGTVALALQIVEKILPRTKGKFKHKHRR
jgi:hypothetical protein